MAISTTSSMATAHTTTSFLLKPTPKLLPFFKINTITPHQTYLHNNKSRLLLQVKSSADNKQEQSNSSSEAAADTSATATMNNKEEEKEEEAWEEINPTEMAKEPPSLISPLNVQKALRGIAITDVDHYARLGLQIGSTYDQVGVAYQSKLDELSTQELDEEEFNNKTQLLKESYMILSSVEERRLYDWSLARNENPERYVWPFEVDITQTPKDGTPPPQEPENEGPTRVVGYFFVGWLVLSVILSIALNQ